MAGSKSRVRGMGTCARGAGPEPVRPSSERLRNLGCVWVGPSSLPGGAPRRFARPRVLGFGRWVVFPAPSLARKPMRGVPRRSGLEVGRPASRLGFLATTGAWKREGSPLGRPCSADAPEDFHRIGDKGAPPSEVASPGADSDFLIGMARPDLGGRSTPTLLRSLGLTVPNSSGARLDRFQTPRSGPPPYSFGSGAACAPIARAHAGTSRIAARCRPHDDAETRAQQPSEFSPNCGPFSKECRNDTHTHVHGHTFP